MTSKKRGELLSKRFALYDDDPEEIIFDEGEKLLFGKHPLADKYGTADSVARLTRNDIITFYEQRYVAKNMVVTVAGNMHHDEVVDICMRNFAHSSMTESAVPKRKKPRIIPSQTIQLPKDFQQSHLLLGTITEGVRSQQRYAFAVFNTLLGDGMSSRLYQSIREKSGLAYSIYSSLQLLSDCGTLSIYAALDQSKVEYARESIAKEIDNLCKYHVPKRNCKE